MPNYKCWPSVATFNCVLNLLVSAKQFEVVHEVYMGASKLAKKFMQRMIERGINPSFESYKMVIQGFCRKNAAEDVEWALREMVGHGFVPKLGMWKLMVQCVFSYKNGISSDSNSLLCEII